MYDMYFTKMSIGRMGICKSVTKKCVKCRKKKRERRNKKKGGALMWKRQ